MRAHEAGALHGELGWHHSPPWLRAPSDVNGLLPHLWPETVTRNSSGVLCIGGIEVTELAADFGTPAYIMDEQDFVNRCRGFRAAFADDDVYYAGKAFCSKAVLRAAVAEDLNVDVCSGGELAVALAAGVPGERIAMHGNNKSLDELDAALSAGIGRIVVDSFDEILRLSTLAAERGVRPAVLIRVTVGVEAHTHEYIATAHEDQKFGFSVAGGAAFAAAEQILSEGFLDLRGLHSHIGSQIFETSAFEVAARRVLQLQARIRDELGAELPELDLGGGFGMAYTSQDDPLPPADLAERLYKIVGDECDGLGLERPRLALEPGRALIGPAMFTLYEVGTVKPVELDAGASRTYVSVDGGMSDNIRTALYDASFSCTLASRKSSAPPLLARVVGKHCESGDIVVKDEFLPADVAPGDLLAVPGTGAYCRSMASNYNHLPRPPVVAVADSAARVIVARESVADLLRLDVG